MMTMVNEPNPKVLPDDEPRTLANEYLEAHGRGAGDELVLRYWRDDFYKWDGDANVYRPIIEEELRSGVYRYFGDGNWKYKKNGGKPERLKPSPNKVAEVVKAMAMEVQVIGVEEMPDWISGAHRPERMGVMAFRNGLLDVADFEHKGEVNLRPPTPGWFSRTVLPYDFDDSAACPHWLAFLEETLDGDVERIALVQEWFGYCLTTDTAQQKMLMMEGPPRSGKGTIARALIKACGLDNCASTSLSSLGDRFGLEPLVGKSICVCSDAHMGDAQKATAVLETLKRITGEDRCDVDRKNKNALGCVRLYCRFTVAVNELPKLRDASSALESRMLFLPMFNTYVGKEDRTLGGKIEAEAPGIIRWGMDGLLRLRQEGRFTVPTCSKERLQEFVRLSSPVLAFVEDWCEVDPEYSIVKRDLYDAYVRWWKAHEQGKPMGEIQFGTSLTATMAKQGWQFGRSRVRNGERRDKCYEGIRVRMEHVYVPELGFGQSG
jgi:putative DNA primase/helicase